ncbi:uncharacterized protein LOC121391421 isoform X2 [Gigantopelta aegis]|uniref:uncharacterized protein LOC121391421 isoform X2 n=1 Tax=Gigantopelta aegis TaxID=1735272 RepID=UPI001B888EE9|nr:uncharacterized protein LOC121391421 isoform X2 [Gigantopelta aegis]
MISGEHFSDDEDVFFGEISERELLKSNKYARRKTALYVPGLPTEKNLVLRESVEMEEDGPMVAGYESMSSPPSLLGFNVMTSPAVQPIPDNSPPAPNNSPIDADKSPAIGILVNSKLIAEYSLSGETTPVFKVPQNCTVNKEFSPMPRECDSRLWDSGVECGTVDCSVRSTPMSCIKSGKKLVGDADLGSEMGVTVPLNHVPKELVSSPFGVTTDVVNHSAKGTAEVAVKRRLKDPQLQMDLLTKQTRRSLTFSVGSESGMDSEVSVQDESKASTDCEEPAVRKPTTASTPRMSAVPTLDFTSPHLLVSPIAKYKTIDSLKRADTKQSVPSSKLVMSSASAFQRVSSHQAVRRSLRKKPIDEDSVIDNSHMDLSTSCLMDMTSSSCVSENDVSSCGSCYRELSTRQTPPKNRHSIACIETMVTGFRDTINELTKSISQLNNRLSESAVVTSSRNCVQSGKSSSCDVLEQSGHETSYSSVDGVKKVVVASPPFKSVSENVLSLPSTLAGQQLQYVKSRELSLMNLDSSPDSVQSHCSTATQPGLRVSSSDSSGAPFHRPVISSGGVQHHSSSQLTGEILSRTQSFVNDHMEYDCQTEQKENSLDCEPSRKSCCDSSSSTDIPFIDGAPYRICRKTGLPSPPLRPSFSDIDLVNHQTETSDIIRRHRSRTKRKYVAETSRLSWTETGYFDSDSSSSELSDCYNCGSSSESDSSSLLDYSASDSFDFNPALLVTVEGSKERLTTVETNIDVVSAEPSSKVPRKKRSRNKSKMKVDKENTPAVTKKKNSYPKTARSVKTGSASCGDLTTTEEFTCLKVQVNGADCAPADVSQYKKKAPQRWRKPDGFMSLSPVTGKKSKCDEHVERITQLHTMCNGQRIVRYLNFSESPMIIKHYPPPKEAAKVSWSDTVIEEDGVYSPLSSPPAPKPILQQKPSNHMYPFVGDVPSPIILTRTRRSKTLFRKVTQL